MGIAMSSWCYRPIEDGNLLHNRTTRDVQVQTKSCSTWAGVGKPRPAGRMRPGRVFDAARTHFHVSNMILKKNENWKVFAPREPWFRQTDVLLTFLSRSIVPRTPSEIKSGNAWGKPRMFSPYVFHSFLYLTHENTIAFLKAPDLAFVHLLMYLRKCSKQEITYWATKFSLLSPFRDWILITFTHKKENFRNRYCSPVHNHSNRYTYNQMKVEINKQHIAET
jgi:hypothetical protein